MRACVCEYVLKSGSERDEQSRLVNIIFEEKFSK